jgi:hypothetical protein
MSRGSPSDRLVLGRPTLVDLSTLYDGWLCRTIPAAGTARVNAPTARPTSPQGHAPPEFIWASHPS